MSKLSGVVTADWHLGGMAKVFQDPLSRQIAEIHKPYKFAIERGIERVFVPGDMSDIARLGEHELIALITLLLNYDEYIYTDYVLGNHDVSHLGKTSMDVLKVLSDSGFFKRFRVHTKPVAEKIDGVYVSYLPYPFFEVAKAKLPPVVFGHVELIGAIGDNGRPMREGHDDKLKRQKGDFLITGHIHQYQYLESKRAIYPGTLYQKNFGESLPKGFIEFTAKYKNDRLIVDHEFVNSHPNFNLVTKLIRSNKDFDKLSSDQDKRYKLLIEEGVIVPKNLTLDFPNIVYINGASSKVKPNMEGEVVGDQMVSIQDMPKFGITTGLTKYLKDSQLDKKQIRRAKELVNEAKLEVARL